MAIQGQFVSVCCSDGPILYLDCGGSYNNKYEIRIHRNTNTHIQMSTCKMGEIWINSLNYTNVNFLVLKVHIMQDVSIGGNWEEVKPKLPTHMQFFATFCESKIVLKWKGKAILNKIFEGFWRPYTELLTFKVFIDRYVFSAFLLLVLCFVFCSLFFLLLISSLMVWWSFNVIFVPFSLVFVNLL